MSLGRCVFLASAVLLSPVLASTPDIQVLDDLQFGGLVVHPSGGSVVLTADGILLPEGAGAMGPARPLSAAGRFRLAGPPNASFTVKVDPARPVLNHPAGGSVQVVQLLGSPGSFQGRFDGTGQAEFRLGGRLDIAAHSPAGLYRAGPVKLQLHVAGAAAATIQKSFGISVLVRLPLTLSSAGPLDFGSLLPGRLPGWFEVLAGGGFRTLGAEGPTLVQGVPRPAAFLLQGPAGSCYSIRLPRGMTLTGPGAPMRVQGFSCDLPLQGTLQGTGTVLHVGGQLLVDPNQAHGSYRGTFTVEICYP